MRRARGTLIVVFSLVGFLALAAVMKRGLRSLSSERFIVTLESVGPPARRLPLERPLRVRLGGQAAAGPAWAAALILGGDGALLRGPEIMAPETDERGRRAYVVEFGELAPLGAAPAGGSLVAVALRLPGEAPPPAERAAIFQRLRQAARPAPGEAHPEVFGRLLQEARALGGHGEMIAAEARPPAPGATP